MRHFAKKDFVQAGSSDTPLRHFAKKDFVQAVSSEPPLRRLAKRFVQAGSRDTPLRYFAKNVFGRLSAGIGYGFNGLTKNLYDGTMSLRLLIWTAEGAGRLLLM